MGLWSCQVTVGSRDSKLSWLALVATICIYCSNIGFLSCFSIFYNSLLEKYGESREKTAWVGSITFALTYGLTPVGHLVSQKLSVRQSVILGTALTGSSLLATSFARELNVVFVTFSLIYGVGSSVLFMTAMRAASLYFDRRYSTAIGLITGGTALLQIPLTRLVVSLVDDYGLEGTFQIYAAVSTLICLVCSIAFFPTSYESEDKKALSQNESMLEPYKTLFKSRPFCLWLVMQFIVCLEYSVSSVHQVQFALESGVPKKTAQLFPFFSAIGASLGRCLNGLIFDLKCVNKVRGFQLLLFITGLTSLIGSFSTNEVHLIAFIWIFSTLEGATHCSNFPTMRSIVGGLYMDAAVSITMLFASITIMLGPPMVGLIVDKTKSYKSFFYVAGTPLLIGCAMLFGLQCIKEFRHDASLDKINEELRNIDEHETVIETGKLYLLQLETNV